MVTGVISFCPRPTVHRLGLNPGLLGIDRLLLKISRLCCVQFTSLLVCTVPQVTQWSQVSSIRRQCCVSRDSMWRIMANCPARALRCGTGEQTCKPCLAIFIISGGYNNRTLHEESAYTSTFTFE